MTSPFAFGCCEGVSTLEWYKVLPVACCAPWVYGKSLERWSSGEDASVTMLEPSCACCALCCCGAWPCLLAAGTLIRTKNGESCGWAFAAELFGVCTGSVCQHYAYAVLPSPKKGAILLT